MWIPESWRNVPDRELASLLTEHVRQMVPGTDVEVLWDGMWILRSG